jgi:hypothetical protein
MGRGGGGVRKRTSRDFGQILLIRLRRTLRERCLTWQRQRQGLGGCGEGRGVGFGNMQHQCRQRRCIPGILVVSRDFGRARDDQP